MSEENSPKAGWGKQALFSRSEDSIEHLSIALEKEESGDLHGALSELNLAIKLDPGSAAAHVNRGRIFGRLGSFNKALADLDKANLLRPGDDFCHLTLGQVHELMNRPDKARTSYRNAINCLQSKDNYMAKIQLEITQGNTPQAIADAFEAYKYAYESGSESGAARKILRGLLGHEPPKPEPNRDKVAKALQAISDLARSPQELNADDISAITNSRLIRQDKSSLGGLVYESRGLSDDGIWRSVELDLPSESTKRHCLSLSINTKQCNISERDIKKRLGIAVLAPSRSGGCIVDPAHLTYRRDWGDLTCCFTSSGFQCVTNLVFWMK